MFSKTSIMFEVENRIKAEKINLVLKNIFASKGEQSILLEGSQVLEQSDLSISLLKNVH